MLVEEAHGPQRCVISLHNLQHFREDIHRFSGLDNYACWVKERAVKRYIRQSNNHKNIEVTFAATEMRREVLKIKGNKEESLERDKVNLQKVCHFIIWLNWSMVKSSILIGFLSSLNFAVWTTKMDCS